MAVITGSTFDPLENRVNVRLQQSVPIADADWNELDDIRKFQQRALLKWFVGDGLPDGSAAFRIDAIAGAADDFVIRSGAGLPPAGTSNVDAGLRFSGQALADGLRVAIPADVNYKAQPLFAAAGPGGIPQIQAIPVIAGPVLAYLDVWERLVTATDDPNLVLGGVGAESCARTVREWAVRTRAGTSVPVAGDSDFSSDHSYLALASINRKLSSPGVAAPIAAADVTDARRARLSLAAIEKRIAFLEAMLYLPMFGPAGAQLNPRTGPVAQSVVLNGRNFGIPPTSVNFGATPATVVSVTANQVRVTVPSLAAGVYPVSITTGGGGPVTAADTFTVTTVPAGAPTFDSVNPLAPKTGPANQLVTLLGTNFNAPGLIVKFGATTVPTVSVSPTQIQIHVPAVAAGSYTVTVTTNQGTISSPVSFNVV